MSAGAPGTGMILSCPGCGKRYRIDEARLGPGRRVRCGGCGSVFATPGPAPGGDAQRAPAARGATAGPAPGRLVLIGDEDREFRDLVWRTLEGLGCRVETTDDGESAFRFAVARRPELLVLNVYLRRLLGVAVCEGVKGSPDLKATKVALVGSVFKSDRFVRGPGNLYGADDYFEDVIPERELHDRLAALLGRHGRSAHPGALAPGAAASRSRAGAILPDAGPAGFDPAPPAFEPPPGLKPPEPGAEIRRLARIMLSDLKIYDPERFRTAILERRFFETFREELTKGKELIDRRFPDLPGRLEILAVALREGLAGERTMAGARPSGSIP